MTSATLIGWEPETPNAFARPVQDESAVAGLSGAVLPGGGGCLLWANGSNVRWAIVSSPTDFIIDDVVPSGDMQTALATGGSIDGTSVFTADGQLYFIVEYRLSGTGYVRLYKADDPDTPSSWSLTATIQSADASSSNVFGSNNGAGIPLVLDTGRWVLVSPRYSTEGGSSWRGMNSGAWYSDDDGVSWISTVNYRHTSLGFPFTRNDTQSLQLAQDPATGDLFWWSGSSSGGTFGAVLWHSTDDGASFAQAETSGHWFNDPRLTVIVDNGTNVYAADTSVTQGSFGIYVNGQPGTAIADWDDTGESWPAPGISFSERTFKTVIAPEGVYVFMRDQVMLLRLVQSNPLWHLGHVAMYGTA